MMDPKKVFLIAGVFVAFVLLTLISRGQIHSNYLAATVASIIIGFTVYLIVRDTQADAKTEVIKTAVLSNSKMLEKSVSVLPNGSLPIELIDDPKDPKHWINFEMEIRAFNAPWTLASESLYPAFKAFLSKDNVKLRVIIFDDRETSGREYSKRIERLSILISKLKSDSVVLSDKIYVKRVVENDIPNTAFFLSCKQSLPTSILYVYPFINETPLVSIELNDAKAIGAMETQFHTYWSKGTDVEMS